MEYKSLGLVAFGLFCLVWGIFMVVRARAAWFLGGNAGWQYANPERLRPSPAGLLFVRFRGAATVIIGVMSLSFGVPIAIAEHIVDTSPGTTGAAARILDRQIRELASSTGRHPHDADIAASAITELLEYLVNEKCLRDGGSTIDSCISVEKEVGLKMSPTPDYNRSGRITVLRAVEENPDEEQTVCLTVPNDPSVPGTTRVGACT